jgi:16S rRNA (adenine(1408)-N(1))-methyltransferase
VATATAHPDTLVIGIDASADGMAEASRRAARPAKKGGLPNALFVVAAAEALPPELDGCADALTVLFPWGSLLRGLLDADPAMLAGLARVTRPGADISVMLSVTPRDNIPGLQTLDERALCMRAGDYAAQGLALLEARPASAEEIARVHSTWAKRLGAGAARSAWTVRLRRAVHPWHTQHPTGGETPGMHVTTSKEGR